MNEWLREILGDVFKEDAKNIAREYEQKGMEKGMEKTQIQMVENGMSNADIRKFTILSLNKISAISRRIKR